MKTPFTTQSAVLVTDKVDPKIIALLDEMTERDMSHGEMFSAILHEITPGVYMRARRLGLSHKQVIDNQTRVKTVYLNLREQYKVSDEDAIEVTDLTPDGPYLHGKHKRDMYRAMIKAGRSHADGLKAMSLVKACLELKHPKFPDRSTGDRERRVENLGRFMVKACESAGPDSSANDMWRAWLVHNGVDPFDVEDAA